MGRLVGGEAEILRAEVRRAVYPHYSSNHSRLQLYYPHQQHYIATCPLVVDGTFVLLKTSYQDPRIWSIRHNVHANESTEQYIQANPLQSQSQHRLGTYSSYRKHHITLCSVIVDLTFVYINGNIQKSNAQLLHGDMTLGMEMPDRERLFTIRHVSVYSSTHKCNPSDTPTSTSSLRRLITLFPKEPPKNIHIHQIHEVCCCLHEQHLLCTLQSTWRWKIQIRIH
jgi:hypothetical protein